MSRDSKYIVGLVVLAIATTGALFLVQAERAPAGPGPVTAVLEIAHEPPIRLFETPAWKQEARIPYKDVVQSEMHRLKFDRVLRAALANLEASGKPWRALLRIDEPPIDWLKENLTVTSTGSFVLVGLRGEVRPADRAAIVNAVVEAYVSDIQEERNAHHARIQEVNKLRNKYQNDLQEYRNKLEELHRSGIDPSDSATGQLMPEQRERLAEQTLADLARVEAELRAARAEKAAGAKDAAPGGSGADLDRRIAVLEEQARLTREAVASYAPYAREMSRDAVEVATLRDEARRTEEMLTAIDRELMRMEIEMDAPDRIRVVDLAVPSSR